MIVSTHAQVVELVYTRDLKSLTERYAGSIPALGTNIKLVCAWYEKQ